MIHSKDIFSNCDLIKFELTLMEEVRAPSSTLEKPTAEFQVLAPSPDFVGAQLGTVPTWEQFFYLHSCKLMR